MPRRKEYDRETVLRKAVQLFWRNGFEGATMAQLVTATGLNSASMYQEFGGKEEVYCAVLNATHHSIYVSMLEPMRKQPGLVTLKLYVGKMAELAAAKDYAGCIYLNNLAGRNVLPPRVMRKVENYCRQIHELIEGCLAAAQREGDIPAGRDPRVLAAYVTCFMQGLTFYGRLPRYKRQINAATSHLISTLSV